MLAEVSVHKPGQSVKLVRDPGEADIDMVHALLVKRPALNLHLLHLSLAALDLGPDHQCVLQPDDLLLKVHLSININSEPTENHPAA